MSQLHKRTLFAYGLPAIPMAILSLPIFIYLPKFYAEDIGFGLAAVGALIMISRIWDLVTDPLVGWLSDRTPAPYPRRHVWILAGVPLVMIGAWQVFIPSDDITQYQFLGWMLILYLGWTMVMLPYNALSAEISDDYHERNAVNAWREGGGLIGAVGILTAIALVVGSDAPDGSLTLMALCLFVLLPLTAVIMWAVVPDTTRFQKQKEKRSWKDSMKLIKDNDAFRILLSSYLFNTIANALPASLFLMYVGDVLQASEYEGPLLLIYFLAGVLAMPIWTKFGEKYDKRKLWSVAMIAACVVFAAVPFLGEGDIIAFGVICVLTGICLGADLILPPSMQADVIDKDQLDSGQPRAGLFFAMWSAATKIAMALGIGLFLPLVEWTGYETGQPDTATYVPWFYAGVPVILKAISIVLIMRYPITAAVQNDIKNRLHDRKVCS